MRKEFRVGYEKPKFIEKNIKSVVTYGTEYSDLCGDGNDDDNGNDPSKPSKPNDGEDDDNDPDKKEVGTLSECNALLLWLSCGNYTLFYEDIKNNVLENVRYIANLDSSNCQDSTDDTCELSYEDLVKML